MNGYPKVFNIEADPREEHNITVLAGKDGGLGGRPMSAHGPSLPTWALQQVGSYPAYTGRADVVGTAAHDRCCFERIHGALSAEPPLKNPFSRHRPNSEIDRPWPVSSGL